MSTSEILPIQRRWKAILPCNELLIGAAVFASACVSLWITRAPNGIALFWPSCGIAAAFLIRLPRVRWSIAVLLVLLATFFANTLVGHRSLAVSALFAGINGVEIALMVAAFRYVLTFPYPNISISQAAVMTFHFGVAIPGLAAVFAGFVLRDQFAVSFAQGTLHWWSSHTIGACLLGPPLILFSAKEVKRLVSRNYLVVNLLTLVGCLAGCYFAIRYVRFPFVVIGATLLIAAFRLGGFGASVLSLAIGLVITNLWILEIRPLGLDASASSSGSLIGLPVLALLATVMPPIAVGLGSDARRAGARALRESERRFRQSMEHSPIGMLISDLNGIWGYTNLALQQMLGYTAAEFRALPPGGPSKAEDWKASETRWARLLSGEIDFYDTVRSFQHKNGEWVWTHVAVSVLRDDNGKPIHLIAQIDSLEARQRAEEKLAEERERLRITLGTINDAVVTTDASTRITYINLAAEHLLGLEMKAVEGRRVDEVIYLMDPKSSKAAANLIGQSAFHGKVFRREEACLMHRPDGTICYVTDVVSPVLDATGATSGMVIVFHDATLDVDRARDLQHRALHDPLTGLSNRAEFAQQLHTAFRKSSHLSRPATVMAIDLDRFKAVNDAAGHAAGDAILCSVAEVCRNTVRSSDTVARLGGDEFAILLNNCGEERAAYIGQQLLRALNAIKLDWNGSHCTVGASIGVAIRTSNMSDEKQWLNAADKACYVAKAEGGGRLRIAIPPEADEILMKQA